MVGLPTVTTRLHGNLLCKSKGITMKVLVACEYSGIVRDAFTRAGADATSCDLLPTESQGKHYQGNVMDIINSENWDLMIAHPPCTYLSFAGGAYWNRPGREYKRLEALKLFADLLNAPIPKICVENPMGIADAVIRKHDQIIHPYYFGESEMKRTCLWLKGLPKLVHIKETTLFDFRTHTTKPSPIYVDYTGKKRYRTDSISGGNYGKDRSRFFKGIADAMAEQWME